MFGKKKQKKKDALSNNKKPEKNAEKKQKKGFLDLDEDEFEDLMEDLDNYN